jgi:hypothetical protein
MFSLLLLQRDKIAEKQPRTAAFVLFVRPPQYTLRAKEEHCMLLQTRNKERAKLTGFVKHYFSYSC